MDEVATSAAQTGRKQSIGCGGCAAALDVAKDGHAGFELGEIFQLFGKPHGVALMAHIQSGQLDFGLLLIVQGAGAFQFLFRRQKRAGVVPAHGAFGHGDDTEVGSMPAALLDRKGDFFHVVGYFRDENGISTASDA